MSDNDGKWVNVMGKIYELSSRIHKKFRWRISSIFLVLNILFWCLLSFAIASVGALVLRGTLEGCGIFLFCVVGYTGFIVGFLGGALFLGNNE